MPHFPLRRTLIMVVAGMSLGLLAGCGGSSPLDIRTPTPGATSTRPAAQETAPPAASPTPQTNEYTVQDGDTLSGIAAQFGVSVDQIVALNGLGDANQIAVGQVLKIPVPSP